jgi:hypothetical protein
MHLSTILRRSTISILPQKVVTIKKYRPKNAALALIFADFLDNP